ncbi:yrdC domain-containing protein, mitochondrial [Glossina fuscipes]|uniref:Threonylcarbamoyl-AMP synthase n=1 Tax=Glossina fuscipes TaxID=7396 RepID=A0A9C5YYU9_9MUSC|nr:yrdC domain-containing protein, mitochondrial [Glossina fuscipes]
MSTITKLVFNFQRKCYSTVGMEIMKRARRKAECVYNVDDPVTLSIARECLMAGSVIGLPTDTVYGFACNANNETAIRHLYTIKGRNFDKPVAICVKNIADFRKYGQANHLSDTLLESLLPGPITIIVQRSEHLNNRFLNPNTIKIGIRIPKSQFIQDLCSLYDEQPLALTSANRSSERSSLNIQEFKELWPMLGGIFDAGQIGNSEESRFASTVIDLTQPGFYQIIRDGVALKQTLDILHLYGLEPKCF